MTAPAGPTVKIACLQTRPMPDFASALDEALGLADQAVDAGAAFLLLPEYCGGLKSDGAALTPPVAAEGDHPVLQGLRDFAGARGVWIMVGSIAVQGAGGKIINRGYVLDASGAIVSRYDKIHMFDIQLSDTEVYRESATISPGDRAALVETPFGNIGHTICYDLRFPQLYRDLAQAGADILTAPAAFTKKTGEAHWHILNQARAVENGA
ncbi:MAG: nitrilase-related carbon-nitrogen hydrolase, partial [Pikeienuella sp.]